MYLHAICILQYFKNLIKFLNFQKISKLYLKKKKKNFKLKISKMSKTFKIFDKILNFHKISKTLKIFHDFKKFI